MLRPSTAQFWAFLSMLFRREFGNVDGEHKCFIDFEIVAFGEFVILHVVFHYERRIILKYRIGKHDVLCIDAYCTEKRRKLLKV